MVCDLRKQYVLHSPRSRILEKVLAGWAYTGSPRGWQQNKMKSDTNQMNRKVFISVSSMLLIALLPGPEAAAGVHWKPTETKISDLMLPNPS